MGDGSLFLLDSGSSVSRRPRVLDFNLAGGSVESSKPTEKVGFFVRMSSGTGAGEGERGAGDSTPILPNITFWFAEVEDLLGGDFKTRSTCVLMVVFFGVFVLSAVLF